MVPSEPTLAHRLIAAATALEDLAKMYGHKLPDKTPYSAWELRQELHLWESA